MNEKFKDVTDEELATQREAKHGEFVTAKESAKPTDKDSVAAAVALANEVDEYDAEIAERSTAAAEAQAEFDALQTREFATAEVEAEGTDKVEVEVEAKEPVAQVEEPAEPVAAEPTAAAPVAAKTTAKATGRVATLAARTTRPAAPSAQEQAEKAALSIVAAVDSGFSGDITFEQVGESILEKMKSFAAPDGDGSKEEIRQFPTASVRIDFPEELTVHGDMGPEQIEDIFRHAADERRLEGNSLVAAGGWCAPSEVLYDLSEDESLDGILSLPEVAVKRGGIRFTPGPQFADFYASPGFKQTESQAIAGTSKTSVEVTCPTFTEVRLDVMGLWIKVPILTEVGYPELTRRFASGTMTAHEHWKNADIIARLVALSTTRAVGGAGLGSVVNDALEALGLMADQRRQSQRLKFDRTMEVVIPFWVKNLYLNDLGRRAGHDGPGTEAELNRHFAEKKLNVQWVYDWQILPSAAGDLTYPTSYNVLMYPAGTFVKGTSAVIKLGAIYDSAQLATNEYTGSFSEEGVLVAKMKLGSDYVTGMPVCAAGRAGALNFTCS